jgi:hypothetical protein
MTKPILFTKRELLTPIDEALSRIGEMKTSIPEGPKVVLEGLFALAVASFETSIIDTLRILYNHDPGRIYLGSQKGLKENAELTVEDVLNNRGLRQLIKRRLRNISYLNIEDILLKFIGALQISKGNILAQLDKIKEIKATRNLLIHNNLRINGDYLKSSGSLARQTNRNYQLKIDSKYFETSINILSETLESIKKEVEIKYKGYTRLRAINELFKYVLPTSTMKLENEFHVLVAEDRLGGRKTEKSNRSVLSTSESYIFDLWIAHTYGEPVPTPRGIFWHLGYGTQDKINFLMRNADILK